MATIKDVAKLAGVSITTVSIIINGKAKERKISDSTHKRVTEAMRSLGYQPNMSARRLRSEVGDRPTIAFFWPLDFRTIILASFINAMHAQIKALSWNCEFVVQTYDSGNLKKCDASILQTGYSAVIVGGCSTEDQKYLESLDPQMPLILINGDTEKFSSVSTDNKAVELTAARLIRTRGFTEAAVIASHSSLTATAERLQHFLDTCAEVGVSVAPEHLIRKNGTIEDGYQAAKELADMSDAPRVVFCDYDTLAVGALRAFLDCGIKVPDDMEVLSISMLPHEFTEFTTPSLSIIDMPNREIGGAIINLLREKLLTNSLEPTHLKFPPQWVERESFRSIETISRSI